MSVRPFIEVVSGPARASVATETIAGILGVAKQTNGQADWLPFADDQRLYIVPTVDDTVAGYQIHSLDDPSIHGPYDLFTTLCDQTDWHVRLDWDELEYLDKSFPYRSLDSAEA